MSEQLRWAGSTSARRRIAHSDFTQSGSYAILTAAPAHTALSGLEVDPYSFPFPRKIQLT